VSDLVHVPLDPEIVTYHLMDAALIQATGLMDHIAETASYGVTSPPNTWDPTFINFQVWRVVARDAWEAPKFVDKLRVWFMPTGWRPEGARPLPKGEWKRDKAGDKEFKRGFTGMVLDPIYTIFDAVMNDKKEKYEKMLGALGVIAGLWSDKFDQMAAFQNFVIMPMTFLSGVFYSIHSLPPFWQTVSHLNPFFYLIDGFRYGFFGVSDVSPWTSLALVGGANLIVAAIALHLLRIGYKIRG
jgi:hypothetical protein